MPLRFGPLALSGAAILAAALLTPADARACGGCFHPEDQPETTVVTGHRMAFSVSPTQTVLWDQVKYAGDPKDFAWVLPIKPGARIELASNAWFEALDAATTTRVVAPTLNCVFKDVDDGQASSGCGCGPLLAGTRTFDAVGATDRALDEGSAPPPPVTVTHEESVGPYDTVTVHANVQGALTGWLKDHGYAIDATVQPIIDAYTKDNFDFIAMRLKPKAGVKQMKPVRVVSPGATPVLPLRMVAAGTGANVTMTLFVIGEGRWEPANFPNATVDAKDLSWDFQTNASDYAEARKKALATQEGRTWLSVYAKHGSLLSPVVNPVSKGRVQYGPSSAVGNPPSTIADSYRLQAVTTGEANNGACGDAIPSYAMSAGVVVDVCSHPETGGGGTGGGGGAGGGKPSATCGSPQIGQIDARVFSCDDLDDLGVALTGLHPRDVWLTRIEAALPRAALKDDLILQASSDQAEVENWKQATTPVNPPCTLAQNSAPAAALLPGTGDDPRGPSAQGGLGRRASTELTFFTVSLMALGAMIARRSRRALVVSRAR
jgi:hypothetical protein